MNKTSVKVTLKLTWKLRIQFIRMAFSRGPSISLIDYDVGEVLIKETKQREYND